MSWAKLSPTINVRILHIARKKHSNLPLVFIKLLPAFDIYLIKEYSLVWLANFQIHNGINVNDVLNVKIDEILVKNSLIILIYLPYFHPNLCFLLGYFLIYGCFNLNKFACNMAKYVKPVCDFNITPTRTDVIVYNWFSMFCSGLRQRWHTRAGAPSP